MAQWADVPFDRELFTNADAAVLSNSMVALENGYANEGGGQSRFPGLVPFKTLDPTAARFYLTEWRGDLVAVSSLGRTYRIDPGGTVLDVTGVPLRGGKRPIFTKTEYELVMAAGGEILRLNDGKTEILSRTAPESTHVAFIDGYLIAIEPNSGRFRHSLPGQYEVWEFLDTFTAEGKPDDLIACVVTPYRELLLIGPESVEQFERQADGTRPFFRRWTTGDGVQAAYTVLAITNGTYAINDKSEFVRFSAQVSRSESDKIAKDLAVVTNWKDAWTAEILISGQKFIVLQVPEEPNPYGTKGVTFLFDYRTRRWSTLWGWNSDAGVPERWPGWSHLRLWGRNFVGVEGGIAEIDPTVFKFPSGPQRMLWRTAPIDKWGKSRIDQWEVRIKRGASRNYETEPLLHMRAIRDGKVSGGWRQVKLGKPGDRTLTYAGGPLGTAQDWTFELYCTADCEIEFKGMQVYVERLPR